MSASEAWLGVCVLYNADSESAQNVTAIAAAFCEGHEAYEVLLRDTAARIGYRLMWSEDVLPAGQWIARNPTDSTAAGLARAVHSGHLVEIGTLVPANAPATVDAAQSYLIIEEIEGVEPLDMQLGAMHRKTVPDALLEPLFGQPAPTEAEIAHYGHAEAIPPLKTYAILDAAKMPYLLTGLLENAGLRYQSLFQGPTQEELKEHAPYLVELEDGNSFTEKLFTGPKGINGLWDKELGIYIRSRANFEDIRKHFRKFTRVQDENGKWFYFRFYASETVRTIIAALDETQFEKFGKDITLIACSSKNSFCTLTRPPETTVLKRQRSPDAQI